MINLDNNSVSICILTAILGFLVYFFFFKNEDLNIFNTDTISDDDESYEQQFDNNSGIPENMEDDTGLNSEMIMENNNSKNVEAEIMDSPHDIRVNYNKQSKRRLKNNKNRSKKNEQNNNGNGNSNPRNKNIGKKLLDSSMMVDDRNQYVSSLDYFPNESGEVRRKLRHRNSASPGEYKKSSYSGDKRGNLGPSSWDMHFDHNNNIIGNSQTGENTNFLPSDETNGGLAVFKSKGREYCGGNQDCDPEDLFDIDKYLPQEANDDWFETVPEPISVKNRNLVNIVKPIGINTIGNTRKGASHDIRGTPACPKFVVAPWMNSSIEPDVNLKPLF